MPVYEKLKSANSRNKRAEKYKFARKTGEDLILALVRAPICVSRVSQCRGQIKAARVTYSSHTLYRKKCMKARIAKIKILFILGLVIRNPVNVNIGVKVNGRITFYLTFSA